MGKTKIRDIKVMMLRLGAPAPDPALVREIDV
jgi:hypothetical protein